MSGPLTGVRVVEIGGIGPGPFAGMLLADLGAEVVRVDRPRADGDRETHRVLLRGRRSIAVDLKDPRGRNVVLALVERSDILLEGFRPGVMERLGLGPDAALRRRPGLVYGRMTGWGQVGPLANVAGHDINYIAVAGALAPIVASDLAPTPPLNMLGDFGGGGMLLACGVIAALLHARQSGKGQVVDAAIVDGVALLTAMLHSMRASGQWAAPRGQNLFDGGAPFYGVYRTADGHWVAVGAIEPQFYARLIDGLGLGEEIDDVAQHDARHWPRLRQLFADRFAQRTKSQWLEIFAGGDACVTGVTDPADVLSEPQLAARRTYVEADELLQPAPAPRFSRTTLTLPAPAPSPGADTGAVLAELGLTCEQITELELAGVVNAPPAGATNLKD